MGDNNDFDFGALPNEQLSLLEGDFFDTVNGTPENIKKKEDEAEELENLFEEKEEKEKEEEEKEEGEEEEESTPKESFFEAKEDTKEEEEDDNYFTANAEGMIKLGLWSENEEIALPSNEEEFIERAQYEHQLGAQKILNNYISKFGDKSQDVFKAIDSIFTKGVNPDYYINSIRKIESFKGLDTENEEHQEYIVKESLISEGFDEEVVEKKLSRIKSYGELEQEAEERLPLLLKREEKALERSVAQKQKETEEREKLRENVFNKSQKILTKALSQKELGGVPLVNKNKADELLDYVSTEKYQFNGTPITEFEAWWIELQKEENLELRLKLALLAKNNLNVSSIEKKAVSKEKESLFRRTKHFDKQANKQSGNSDFIFN